jgi:hypothetical protein
VPRQCGWAGYATRVELCTMEPRSDASPLHVHVRWEWPVLGDAGKCRQLREQSSPLDTAEPAAESASLDVSSARDD